MIRFVFQLVQMLVISAAAIAVAIAGVVYLARMGGPVRPDEYHAFSQAEFITLVLAALTVVLTALAIVLALGGAVGYVAIRAAATSAAEAAARAAADQAAREVAQQVAAVEARDIAEKVAREVAPAVAAREAENQFKLFTTGADSSGFADAAGGEGANPPAV